MAASIAVSTSASSVFDSPDIENFFEGFLNDIIAQLSSGVLSPVVPFSKLCAFGIIGIPYWQGYIQGMLNQRFTHQVDLVGNTVTLHPINAVPVSGHMLFNAMATDQASVTHPGSDSTAVTTSTIANIPASEDGEEGGTQPPLKAKVPRPPNSWILYRQEWHPKIVQQFPGLHNNEISKIIGKQWNQETEAVREEYKHKAEDAKHQHAIDHPGYQYQPRKPSEKKKRMTKNKLAKLKAQANANGPLDPMVDVGEMLNDVVGEEYTTIHQGFPAGPVLQQVGTANNLLAFDASEDPEGLLEEQIMVWNANNPHLTGHVGMQRPAALFAAPMSNGQHHSKIPKFPVPMSANPGADMGMASNPANIFEPSRVPSNVDNTAALHRQDRIFEAVFNDLFNFEAYTEPIIQGNNAENTLDYFHSDYELDLEDNGNIHN